MGVAGEIFVRVALPEAGAPSAGHAYFSDFYRMGDDGTITWPPRSRVRYAKVYAGDVEFDVTFPTNDLGLIDEVDYAPPSPARRRVAVVGDSFTAGYHGGRPWLTALRESRAGDDIALYNLGIGGAGFEQFEELLASLAPRIDFNEILVVAISDDLKRKLWYPDVDAGWARFCRREVPVWRCRLQPPAARIVPFDATLADLASGAAGAVTPRSLATRSALATLAYRSLTASRRGAGRNPDARSRRIEGSHLALERIVAAHAPRPVTVVHVPMRREVERGAYASYADGLPEAARSAGATYVDGLRTCDWSPGMFFPNDPHPNAAGYARLAECVGVVLSGRTPRS